MRLSQDETRALGFVALLLAVAAVARVARMPAPVAAEIEAADLGVLGRATEEAVADRDRRSRPLGADERIDPNTAPAAELDRLPGVGAALADRIVAERERGGAFRSVADLTRVAGVGTGLVERLGPHLALPARSAAVPGSGAVAERILAPVAGAGPAGDGERRDPPVEPLDLNRADAAAFERLPGIGPVLARRIVAYRDSAGGFRSIDELERVPGIGPASMDRLRSHLRLFP